MAFSSSSLHGPIIHFTQLDDLQDEAKVLEPLNDFFLKPDLQPVHFGISINSIFDRIFVEVSQLVFKFLKGNSNQNCSIFYRFHNSGELAV